jgi:hypothetical protein
VRIQYSAMRDDDTLDSFSSAPSDEVLKVKKQYTCAARS